MPEPIEGESAVVPPSHEAAPAEPSFLDSMVAGMEAKESAKNGPAPSAEAPPAEVPEDDLDPAKDKPEPEAKLAPEATPEDDELGIGKFVPKKKATTAPAAPKAAEKPAPTSKSPTDQLPIPKGVTPQKWFRNIYDTTKRELDEIKPKYTALEQKVADLEKRSATPEVEAKWKAEVENERKRAEAAEENLRIVGYEKSPDFDRDHIAPLKKAWKDAYDELVEQEVDVDGVPRKTTISDVQEVVGIPNTIQANKKARELFGPDAAPAVLQARKDIRSLIAKRDEAVETWKNKGTQHQQQQEQERQELQATGQKTYESRLSSYAEKYPEIWAPTDEKEKAALSTLDPIIDVALFGKNVPKFNTQREAFEFWGKAKADLAARARATPVLLLRNASLQERLEAVEAELKGYKSSDPDLGNKGEGEGRKAPSGKAEPGSLKGMLAAIDSMPGI